MNSEILLPPVPETKQWLQERLAALRRVGALRFGDTAVKEKKKTDKDKAARMKEPGTAAGPVLCAPTGEKQQGLKGEILLTHAYYLPLVRRDRRIMRPYVPLGPLYVAGYLREQGHPASFFDTTFMEGPAAFAAHLALRRPALVGISALETTRANALAMIRICREKGIGVVAGGPDPSNEPDLYMAGGADLVVVGEGEETMAEVVSAVENGKDIDGIPGVHRAAGSFVPRPFIEPLDTLPFPARDLVDHRPYAAAWRRFHGATSLQLSVSRGCPYHCGACAKPVFGKRFRQRSAVNVAEEMLFLKMIYSPDRLLITDDIFGYDPAWTSEFRKAVAQKRARIPFECFSRVDLVDREILREIKDAGCFRVWYGIDSGSQKLLNRMRKGFRVEDVRKAVRCTKELGLEAAISLTLGYPSETISDLEQTRQLVRELKPDRCSVSIAYPVKGTLLYREVEDILLPLRHTCRSEEDDILTFRSRYSQNFYDVVRRLIDRESYVYAHPFCGLKEKMQYGLCRLGYGIMKTGVNPS
jgi:radical SAM superfamily enzyme YgiQ (UPF0313 family)